MARIGLWRLNSQGVSALQKKYREGRWVNVPAFCQAVGISRSTYYELIRRERWFEQATLQDKLKAIGFGEADFPKLCEFRDSEQQIAALDAPKGPHNLPRAVTSFIGREREIAQVHMLLQTAPLLTLTGVGGSGKTRLALQVAGDLCETFPDGVWLVELASLSDPILVPQAVASVLSLREQSGTPLLQTILQAIDSRCLLLLLDNCEHLLTACSQLVSALLRACPHLRVLATSRERLGIAGEQIYRVPSLALPDLKPPLTVASLDQVEAVRLFVDRARMSRSDFVLSDHNVAAVAALCHRLDGIPLALELAAARVRSLSVEDIVARLESQFDLLTGGDRSALPRHQTLRALIDWSYDLLTPQEKRLLQQLSVFPGGWTLEAAEQVCTGEVLEPLTSLVDKSLVLAEEREGSVRYRMYDTLRQYAAEKLQAIGETEAVFVRRRDWALGFALEAGKGLLGGKDQERWLQRLETEHDNLRAALAWSGPDSAGAQTEMQLAAALWRFWMVRGYVKEGREHLRRALERESAQERTVVRSHALSAAGSLADNQGDYSTARALYLESISIRQEVAAKSQEWTDKSHVADLFRSLGYITMRQGDTAFAREMFQKSQVVYLELIQGCRERGDRRELADALVGPGLVASELGDNVYARTLLEESLALRRELAEAPLIANALTNLCFVARREGDYAEVRALLEECLNIKRERSDQRGVALAYHELGEAAYRQGDYAAAQNYYATGLPMFGELGDRQHVALCLEGMARVLLAQGEARQAVRHWGSAAALREMIGAPIALDVRAEYKGHITQARLALGENDFAIAWSEGLALTWEQVALPDCP